MCFEVIFVWDPHGSEFDCDLIDMAEKYHMTVKSAACDGGNGQDIASAMHTLQQPQFWYFFATITPSALACKNIITGNPDHVWLWPVTNLSEAGFF